jgi:hypothetical protein
MKMGSPMILTCMNRILQNPQNMRLNIYRYEGILILEMKVVYGINPNQGKRSSSQVCCKFY